MPERPLPYESLLYRHKLSQTLAWALWHPVINSFPPKLNHIEPGKFSVYTEWKTLLRIINSFIWKKHFPFSYLTVVSFTAPKQKKTISNRVYQWIVEWKAVRQTASASIELIQINYFNIWVAMRRQRGRRLKFSLTYGRWL